VGPVLIIHQWLRPRPALRGKTGTVNRGMPLSSYLTALTASHRRGRGSAGLHQSEPPYQAPSEERTWLARCRRRRPASDLALARACSVLIVRFGRCRLDRRLTQDLPWVTSSPVPPTVHDTTLRTYWY
jgi:hypothetical protein